MKSNIACVVAILIINKVISITMFTSYPIQQNNDQYYAQKHLTSHSHSTTRISPYNNKLATIGMETASTGHRSQCITLNLT